MFNQCLWAFLQKKKKEMNILHAFEANGAYTESLFCAKIHSIGKYQHALGTGTVPRNQYQENLLEDKVVIF